MEQNALYIAVKDNRGDLVELLLSHGAAGTIRSESGNLSGGSDAYQIAEDLQREDIRLLLDQYEILTEPLTFISEARVTANGLRMRSSSSLDGEILHSFNAGDSIRVTKRSGRREAIGNHYSYWFFVESDQGNGWVYGAFIEMQVPLFGLP